MASNKKSKCPKCGKELKQTPGKRAKVFCNSTCRSGYWAKNNKKEVVKEVKEEVKEDVPVSIAGVSATNTIYLEKRRALKEGK